MQSEEMRDQFPDPDQRKAAFRRSELVPPAGEAFHACCSKQDVPEVEAIIGILQGPLEDFWRDMMQDALDTAVERLRELEDQMPTSRVDGLVNSPRATRDEELLILAFLSVLENAASQPLPASLEAALGRATTTLLESGARSQGLTIDLAREPLARAAAREDLKNLLKGRILTRTTDLREQVQEFLRSKRARTPARPGDITEAAAGFRARNLQAWLKRSVDIVGLQTQQWLPAVADQWAYRWFVVGQFLSGIQAGLQVLEARAVIDGKTTAFCRWVNGRAISVNRASSQLATHIEAALKGEVVAMIRNWPMLSSDITTSDDRKVLALNFARVGLPPYHFRCRTTLRWVLR